MINKLSLLLATISLMACDPFRQAERRIDNPNGKTSDEQSVKASVTKGSQQSNSSSIIDTTTSSLVLPFQSLAPRTGLDELLADPVLRAKVPYAQTITNLTHLAMSKSVNPYALEVSNAGIIDVSTETGGACSGAIDFSTSVDLKNAGLSGKVVVTMTFSQVVCPEGSIDGDVAFEAEFDTLAASLKIVNVIEATISDGVATEELNFAFRLEGSLFDTLALDMSVEVDGKFLTLSINGNLNAGAATVAVTGKDGTINCTITGTGTTGTADCEVIGSFSF
jgi:hypothetical protein